MRQFVLLCIIAALMFSCQKKVDVRELYSEWEGREVFLPKEAVFLSDAKDTVVVDVEGRNKILLYADSLGCLACNLKLNEWQTFADSVGAMTGGMVQTLVYVSPKTYKDAKIAVRKSGYTHPVCIDMTDQIGKLNKFPKVAAFRCFMLDGNNRVVLIGNPIANEKVERLYFRTIMEGLTAETAN